MATKKTLTKGRAKGKAEGGKRANARAQERRRLARALASILTANPDGREAREVCRLAGRLADATGSVSHDFRPEQQLAVILRDYDACTFKLAGTDREAAREAYAALVRIAEGGAVLARNTFGLTFSLTVEAVTGVSADAVGRWQLEADTYARILESPDCPDALRSLFARVFSEQLFDKSEVSFADPNVVRVLYPLALVGLQGNLPATADGVTDSLYSIVHHLTPGTLYCAASEAAREMCLARKGAGRGE